MSVHTPGPWVEDRRTGSIWKTDDPTGRVDRKKGVRIAVVDISDESVNEDRANANLIAAAPDLLEALKRYRNSHRADGACIGSESIDGEDCDDCLAADVALAKAEGKTP